MNYDDFKLGDLVVYESPELAGSVFIVISKLPSRERLNLAFVGRPPGTQEPPLGDFDYFRLREADMFRLAEPHEIPVDFKTACQRHLASLQSHVNTRLGYMDAINSALGEQCITPNESPRLLTIEDL